MTIHEIAKRVEAGETIQIRSKHWGLLMQQMDAHLVKASWNIKAQKGVVSISNASTLPVQAPEPQSTVTASAEDAP